MRYITYTAAVGVVALLSACGGGSTSSGGATATPTPATNPGGAPGAAQVTSSSYSVLTGGTTISLPTGTATINGQNVWSGPGSLQAASYENGSTLIIAGTDSSGTPFVGTAGTVADHTISGTATYNGRITVFHGGLGSSPASINIDFATSSVTSSGTVSGKSYSANGTISGGNISGTMVFDGTSGMLHGGTFGTNELATGFSGAGFGGVLHGTK